MSSSTWHFFLKGLMKYDKYFLFKFDFTSYAVIIILIHMYMYRQLSFVCQHKSNGKKMSTQKIPLKFTLILSSLSIYLFFFFKEMTQLSISRIWMFSMRSRPFPNRPHWLLLSLLFTHVSMMYSCLYIILSIQPTYHVHYFLIDILWVRKSTKRNPD